jgi:alanyl-tRNA synthetase
MALFNEKYGSAVRVVAIGAASTYELETSFSKEFCGGTHVQETGEIAGFKIISQESVSAGVRRITAMTGDGLIRYLEERAGIVDKLVDILKCPPVQILERVEKLVGENKKLQKDIKTAAKSVGGDAMGTAAQLLENAEFIGGATVVIGQLPGNDIEAARGAMDMIKKKAPSSVCVFAMADEGSVTLLCGVTDDLVNKGLKAGEIIKQIAPLVGGGGGGRPTMAQAGGKNPGGIGAALEKAKGMILDFGF